jgi:chromosomal replication initiation ATPase DnaA
MSAAVAWRRTMASAKPKFRADNDVVVRDMLQVRREMAERLRLEKERRELENRKRLEEQRRMANAAVDNIRRVMGGESVKHLIARFAKVFGVTEIGILSSRRSQNLVMARQAVMYWSVRRTSLSLPDIGRRLGGKDHTTILHGARTYIAKRSAMGRKLRVAR